MVSQSPLRRSHGSSESTNAWTTRPAGAEWPARRSTRSSSRPERAARQVAARPNAPGISKTGSPALWASYSRSTMARKNPAMSRIVSLDGQLSQMRSSRVGMRAEGRVSKYIIPGSVMTPESTSVSTSASSSAAVRVPLDRPAVGQRLQISARTLAYPVSWPSEENGELADRADSVGRSDATRSEIATASSRSSTPTCTWVPQISCSRARS